AVLLFHLWPNRLTGGYVGVDVFFVISGFLITSHLLRDAEASGRIRVGRFWARRAKRLLPASLLVLALTGIAIVAVVPQTLWRQFLAEVAASTLYVQNWLLAFSSVDYLGADNVPSPVQHFWTLSVEEQFYIALPLILILTLALSKRFRWPMRKTALVTIAAVTAASLAYSVWFTHWSASAAYFSTLTRAWEFGVGALIVALPVRGGRVGRSVVAAIGLIAIAAAIVTFDASTPFPGIAAALPVVGTALVIWAGSGTLVDRVGAFAPVAVLGRISYAVYLWHWPPIVLLPYVTQHPLTTVEKIGILVGTIAIAWISTTQFEDRVRFSPRLLGSRPPRIIAAWMAAAMALVLVVPVAAVTAQERESTRLAAVAEEIEAGSPDCFGAAAFAERGCVNPDLDGVLVPAAADVADDDGNRAECWSRGGTSDFNTCTVGVAEGYDRHLLAIGDSHNNSLVGAYEQIARERNWRIDIAGRGGCYWSDAPLKQPTESDTRECTEWRAQAAAFVAENLDVDGIITMKARRPLTNEIEASGPDEALQAISDGMAGAWDARPDLDVPVIAIIDNPSLPITSRECVEEHGLEAATECAVARADAFPPDGVADAVARAQNVHAIDLSSLFCTEDTCPPVIGNVIVYRDGRHVTGTFARTMVPYLGERIDEILAAAE
ncbi:MAG: acyltransferase family protein, partial [Microbacterium sp.]